MYLREYLYADLDRIRSLAAQLMEGVPEDERTTEKRVKQLSLGIKSIAGSTEDLSSEQYTTKSLADSLFGSLEEILESEGWLNDISDVLNNAETDLSTLRDLYEPGTLVRITSPGLLFDARFVARVLSGVAASADGITTISKANDEPTIKRPQKSSGRYKDQPKGSRPPATDSLEASIEDYDPELLGIDPSFLRALVKLSRGVFAPGVHLILTPRGDDIAITARLQEGRKYLESDAEVLFSRYGTARQSWTLVGSIGAYAEETDMGKIGQFDMIDSNNVIARSKVAGFINYFMQFVGHQGLADIPQHPGFSIVPLAAYRTITRRSELDAYRSDGAIV